jgi:hypothetical protein
MVKVIVGTNGTSRNPEFAGSAWVRLQYVLGLEELGVESFWVDRLQSPVDPRKMPHSLAYLMKRFDRMANDFGFGDRYCVVYKNGERHFGMSEKQLTQLASEADLLINVGGHLPEVSPLMQIPRRAYLDVDPGFTQIWMGHHQSEVGPLLQYDVGVDRHNFFFTVGQNVGRPEFKIPTDGIEWHSIVPPVVLDLWPPHIDETCERFSTVADWRGSQAAIFEDELYGGKRREFIRFLHLPKESQQRIELALFISPHDCEDLALLVGMQWQILDPCLYAGDPESYREFIQYSRAEFSVAKNGYVKANSGWISDRTACYLASGKPALVQSTGLEGRLPTGKGLLTFRTLEEALAGIDAINQNYLAHCQAARQIAEKYFDSDEVLGSILERVGL